jgi:hypothetical protein
MLAPFERWGPESSVEMWDYCVRQRWDGPCCVGYLYAPGGGNSARTKWARANREVSLFPHRRTPFLRSVLIASGPVRVDNELDP